MGTGLTKAFRWTEYYWHLRPMAVKLYAYMCVSAIDYGKTVKVDGVILEPALCTLTREELAMNIYHNEEKVNNLKRYFYELIDAGMMEPLIEHPQRGVAQNYRLLLARRIAERDDIIAFLRGRYKKEKDKELIETLVSRGNEGRQYG